MAPAFVLAPRDEKLRHILELQFDFSAKPANSIGHITGAALISNRPINDPFECSIEGRAHMRVQYSRKPTYRSILKLFQKLRCNAYRTEAMLVSRVVRVVERTHDGIGDKAARRLTQSRCQLEDLSCAVEYGRRLSCRAALVRNEETCIRTLSHGAQNRNDRFEQLRIELPQAPVELIGARHSWILTPSWVGRIDLGSTPKTPLDVSR